MKKKTKGMTVREVIEQLSRLPKEHICEVNYPDGKRRNIRQICDIDKTDAYIVTIFLEE
jgi:hypothetical protein